MDVPIVLIAKKFAWIRKIMRIHKGVSNLDMNNMTIASNHVRTKRNVCIVLKILTHLWITVPVNQTVQVHIYFYEAHLIIFLKTAIIFGTGIYETAVILFVSNFLIPYFANFAMAKSTKLNNNLYVLPVYIFRDITF